VLDLMSAGSLPPMLFFGKDDFKGDTMATMASKSFFTRSMSPVASHTPEVKFVSVSDSVLVAWMSPRAPRTIKRGSMAARETGPKHVCITPAGTCRDREHVLFNSHKGTQRSARFSRMAPRYVLSRPRTTSIGIGGVLADCIKDMGR
jgi:hypothetical protein